MFFSITLTHFQPFLVLENSITLPYLIQMNTSRTLVHMLIPTYHRKLTMYPLNILSSIKYILIHILLGMQSQFLRGKSDKL